MGIMTKNILITGGTGFVGRNLTDLLISKGFTVSILSRSKHTNTDRIFYYTWDIDKQEIEEEAVLKADYVIHLAGENIAAERWSAKRKKAIVKSREVPVQLIRTVLEKHNKSLDAFISASAVGIYGAYNGEEVCSESTPPANDFLGRTCQIWEAAADTVGSMGIRTVKIRTGLVLGENDGLLAKLIPIFKWKLGAAIGSGKQYMPWVYIDDLCDSYYTAVKNENMQGAFNVAIEDNTTNTIFSKALASLYGYKLFLPNVPAFVIKLFLGEMSKIVLTGRRISSKKLEKSGFEFKIKNLDEALKLSVSK
jgi:uncharacterized protein (TIGR01777 family)